MPLYEYLCQRCGKTFEVIQKFSDEPLAVHEGCGGEVERLICAPSLQFKGTGWYVTDYGRNGKSSAARAKAESKGESKGDGKNEKTESKTESKQKPTQA